MWARVSRFKGQTERVDEDIRDSRERGREVAGMPGSRGLYYLVDRESGESIAITLWESEQALRESEEATERIRQESVRQTGGEIVDVRRFEVVFEPADTRGESEQRAA